jgi:hypothetical protein
MDALKKALLYVQLAIGLIPSIVDLVKQFELPGNGPAKAQAVLEIVKATWLIVPEEVQKQLGLDKLEAFVTKVVPVIVTYLNAFGIFKK